MLFRRYEISLPTTFRDGTPVGGEHYARCWMELMEQFGAVTIESQHLQELWAGRGSLRLTGNFTISLDLEDTAETATFFRAWKETLKQRFRVADVWIVSFEICIT